jgi:FMN phosphatase YigB (HAD superfamily)
MIKAIIFDIGGVVYLGEREKFSLLRFYQMHVVWIMKWIRI